MKKRIIILLLAICLALGMVGFALAGASLSNFYPQRQYQDRFSDVPVGEWYHDGVRGAYEYGIMDGKSANTFDPDGSLTIAETIKLAACLHKGYNTGSMGFVESSPWYGVYVDYALENGIIDDEYANYETSATRSDFAMIVANAVPEEATTPINRVADGTIPDVLEYYSFGYAVYRLYRAGILTGSDSAGTFYPGRTLSRAEAATIMMRVMNANMRRRLSLNNPLTAEQIYQMAAPAVFYVEVFDSEGRLLKTGSGFFISETGMAVTNYHVIIGGDTAKITLDNGDVHDIVGVYDYDWKNDMALIKINIDDVEHLECADSSQIKTGAMVYTIGSPLGLQGSFSRGIVSQALRDIEGVEYIQLDASISSGSSGGALLDAAGRVIGVTSATAIEGQNINLAMPINIINGFNRESYVPLEAIKLATEYYPAHFPAPDFGAYFGVEVFDVESSGGVSTYAYRLSDLPYDLEEIIETYSHILEQNLFILFGYYTDEEAEYRLYINPQYGIVLEVGIETVRDTQCLVITIG